MKSIEYADENKLGEFMKELKAHDPETFDQLFNAMIKPNLENLAILLPKLSPVDVERANTMAFKLSEEMLKLHEQGKHKDMNALCVAVENFYVNFYVNLAENLMKAEKKGGKK